MLFSVEKNTNFAPGSNKGNVMNELGLREGLHARLQETFNPLISLNSIKPLTSELSTCWLTL